MESESHERERGGGKEVLKLSGLTESKKINKGREVGKISATM